MSQSWDAEFEERLLEAADYRGFLKPFFSNEPARQRPAPLTFGTFAERAGFASKGFMNDVLAGRKRLTPKSFERVAQGLKLTSQWKDYLRSLVGREEADFQTNKQTAPYFESQLESLRKKIRQRESRATYSNEDPEIVGVFLHPLFPDVYASLGGIETGETLDTILRRSKAPADQVRKVLKEMEAVGLIRIDGETGRFVPRAAALNAKGLNSSHVFRQAYTRALDKAKSRMLSQMRTPSALFMTQTLSVHPDRLPELKKRMAELIESFAAQAEQPDGSCLADICVAFTNNAGDH